MINSIDCPLLTVIIPTHRRPHFLPRAIKSALQAAPNGDVEVIVVPNGSDISWKSVAEKFNNEPKVKWHPIEKAHANAARNYGMKLAQGEYIRFLDDDDFFYSEIAQKQLEKLIELEADISCGQITKTDENGNILEMAHQLDTDDFIEAAIGRGHSTATCALVLKRSITNDCIWDERINNNQDVYWAWFLCIKQELKSFRFKQPVAAWVQHVNGVRVSKGHHRGKTAKITANHLLDVITALKNRNKLSVNRAQSASYILWNCIHSGIMFSPIYWIKISFVARSLSKDTSPNVAMYSWRILKSINPLWVELLLIPWRWLKIICGHKYET